jgi:hypothetical protein
LKSQGQKPSNNPRTAEAGKEEAHNHSEGKVVEFIEARIEALKAADQSAV